MNQSARENIRNILREVSLCQPDNYDQFLDNIERAMGDERALTGLQAREVSLCLTPDLRHAGFTLHEDEDFAYLFHRGSLVGTFNARASSLHLITHHAKKYLEDNITLIRLGEEPCSSSL